MRGEVVSTKVTVDIGVVFLFLLMLLCLGDPSLLDAIIQRVGECK